MKHIFIINPAAGNGASEREYLPKIISYCKEAQVDYEIHRTLNKQEVGTWTAQRASEGDPVRFYAIGGDGTICDVANALAGVKNAELAVVPCGTGNDFVRNFTNVKNFSNFEKLISGKAVPIDLIKYNDSYCANMLCIGADCDVVIRSDELIAQGKSSGAISYARAALDVLPRNPKYRMVYTLDGEEHEEDLLLVAVGNGCYCGGGFKACPKADLQDGMFDVGIVRPVHGLKLLQMLVKYRMGTHLYDKDADKYVKYVQLKEFDLKPVDDCCCAVDGEVFKFEPTHISIVPGALNFVIPEGSEIIR